MDKIIVIPYSGDASFSKRELILKDDDVSSPVVGSSRNRIAGFDNICMANDTPLLPPDKVLAFRENEATYVF